MRKIASRKRPSRIRKIVTGPSAVIVASAVGGVFSLTSALVPHLIPEHFFPLEETSSGPAAPISELVSHPSTSEPSVRPVAELVCSEPAAVPTIIAPPAAPSVAAPAPVAFEAKTLASSLAHAEAKSPVRAESQQHSTARRHPNLTYGVWTIYASKDTRGTVWNKSTLKITSQQETPDGLKVAGFLDWRANGKNAGREYVTGNYVEDTRSLFIEGCRSAGCDRQLALSACSARLSEDGRRLTDGTWGSASAHHRAVPGRWEARR